MICPPKIVQCGPEKHGAINNHEAQKICARGPPKARGPWHFPKLPPFNPPLVRVPLYTKDITIFPFLKSFTSHMVINEEIIIIESYM